MKEHPERATGKERTTARGRATQVHWPKEYVDIASHPTKTALCRPYVCGNAKTKLCRAVRIQLNVVQPTDIDDEFGDGSQNSYKIIKSLTSGARFYTETTVYAYRTMYRFLVVLLARAYGLINSVKATLDVENGPNYAAYQIVRGSISENYVDAIGKLPEYEKIILEMVSELNALPVPSIGGMEEFFKYFSHMYRDDHGVASDYYSFNPWAIGDVVYDDDTHLMTSIDRVFVGGLRIDQLAAEFFRLVDVLRNSTDINNLMADILNVLPSSRFDWMTMLEKHKDFVRQMDGDMMTELGSAPVFMDRAGTSKFGTLNAAGTRIEFLHQNLGTLVADYHFDGDDNVGQLVSTYKGASEFNCYKLALQNEAAEPGHTPAATDKISTTGLYVREIVVLTTLGSSSAAPTSSSTETFYSDSNSTNQTDAEEGGKQLALLYVRFAALPKVDLYNYGKTSGNDNLLWRVEDMKECPLTDVKNNIKAINMLAYSTMHLTTEKQR